MGFVDKLKEAVGLGDDDAAEISWADRLVTATYVTPSGVRISFDYEDVSVNFTKRGTPYEFTDADGTYIQSMGASSRRFPLRIFFWGKDYDRKSKVLEAALREPGVGSLEHPLYDTLEVVPFGDITRRDNLKTAANQSIFEVTFWKTIGLLYPQEGADPAAEVQAALDEFNELSSEQFASQLDINSAAEEGGLLNKMNRSLDVVENGLRKVSDVQKVIADQMKDISDSIHRGLDVLVGQPLTLAFQTKVLIQTPGRSLALLSDKLGAYGNLARAIFSSPPATPGGVGGLGPGANAGGIGNSQTGGTAGSANDSQSPNNFHTDDLFASTLVSGSVVSVLNNVFKNKTESIAAADALSQQFDELTVWRDENYQSVNGQNLDDPDAFIASPASVDTGDTFRSLQNAVSLALGYLIEQSFSLKQESTLELTNPRNVLELCAELYGSVDDNLDFLIESNNLTGSEILELPKGKKIVYYI